MAVWRSVVCVLALLCLQFGGTFVGGANKVSHVPVLVALTEGESITYEYDCEEPERAALCYYIEDGSMSYPELMREEHYLPDGMSLVQQECPLYNVASARINVSLSIWGLLLFYSPDGRCGIEKSTGPRPLRLTINETANDQDVSVTITTQQGQLLNYSCPCEPSVNQPATSTPGNEGGVSLGTVALAVGGSAIVVAGVVVAVLLLWFYWRKSPKKKTGLEECGESSSSEASLSDRSESVSTEARSQQFTDHPPTPLQYSTEVDDGPPPNLNQVQP